MYIISPASPLFPYILAFVIPAIAYVATIHKLPFKGDFLLKSFPILVLAFATWKFIGHETTRVLLITALLFSAAGDISLSFKGEKSFLLGIANFLVAHLVYIILFAQHSSTRSGDWWVYPLLAIFAIGMVVVLFPKLGKMKIPVLVYISVIMVMGVYANMWKGPNERILLIGAVVFMFSDAMIAIDRFVSPVGGSKYFVMSTYYVAQAMIWMAMVGAFK